MSSSHEFSGSAVSTASFGTYLGDGSQLSGITAATSLTQSLFVSPSGDNSTAVVGDLHLPFKTILSATASANIGDTINYLVSFSINPGYHIFTTDTLLSPNGSGNTDIYWEELENFVIEELAYAMIGKTPPFTRIVSQKRPIPAGLTESWFC